MLTADNNTDNIIEGENQEALGQFEEMYKAGVHFGYSRSSRHPAMKNYLFGIRNNVEIFNLEKVYSCFLAAAAFLKELGIKRKKFLLVATKPEVKEIAEKIAGEIGVPYVTDRWLGGTLTNFKAVRTRVNYFEELCQKKESGELAKLIKKEAVKLEKKLQKLERRFIGVRDMKELPAAVLVVDSKEERAAVDEAKKIRIPVIAILNSDCNPGKIEYPVPANDAASSSVQYLLQKLAAAYKEGLEIKSEIQSTKSEANPNDQNSKSI